MKSTKPAESVVARVIASFFFFFFLARILVVVAMSVSNLFKTEITCF